MPIDDAPLAAVFQTVQAEALLAPLARRQREVARKAIAGRSNREIADTLGISGATVKDHMHAILERLTLPSRAALIARDYAAATG